MKQLLMLSLFTLSACNTEYVSVPGEPVETIVNNTITEVVSVTEIETVEVEKTQLFEGFYNLRNGGFIELIADSRGDITVDTTYQNITSVNPKNSTFGEHPRIVGNDIQIIKNTLQWSRNENYTAGHDLEEDVTGANVLGTRRTDYTISLNKNGLLNINIKIWAAKIGDNVNYIVINRNIQEE